MDIETYRRRRAQLRDAIWQPRSVCDHCQKPVRTCYCARLQPFDSHAIFGILMHRNEVKKSVATGRMAHLCLSNSLLFEGTDFTAHPGVNALISNPKNHCVVLSPGPRSTDLSPLSQATRNKLVPEGKRLVIFVIDATWSQAKRVKRLSRNLHALPFICFTPKTPSRFRVRVQPAEHCYSTIEAVHACMELFGNDSAQHLQRLMDVFDSMVEQQLGFETHVRHRRRGTRIAQRRSA